MESEWEGKLPNGLEDRIVGHTANMALFGRVVEVYVPNALEAVVNMIGGTSTGAPAPDPFPGRRPQPEAWPDWRVPPGSKR